ncbi:MAG: YggT family protein [Clostridia bacterium]|nr:YggT family protein [Clostridia bacterium]
MDIAIYILKIFVIGLIDILHLAMLVRALLSWIDPMQEWKISSFLYVVTEPVILPLRRLFEKKRWFEGMPLDMPFMITFLLLFLLGSLLQML